MNIYSSKAVTSGYPGPATRRMRGALLLLLVFQISGCANQVLGWPTGDTGDTGVPDEIAPTVIWTTPNDGVTGIAVNGAILAVFSEAMAPATLDVASFTLSDGGVQQGGAVTVVGDGTVLFSPSSDLDLQTEYTATITTEVTDLAGNRLEEDYVWTFTTGAFLDIEPPRVILTDPDDAADDVLADAQLNATFNEQMNPLTINVGSFQVTGPGAAVVSGTVTYDVSTQTGIFSPDDDLIEDTTYTARITTGVWDLAGNAMEEDYVWTFVVPDSNPPTVISTDPEDGATEVDPEGELYATFSEDMDPLTISALSFLVTGPGATVVVGAVSYDVGLQTGIFTPDSDLLDEVTYTATITTGARDQSGTALVDDYVWSFTIPDGSAPTVIDTDPADGDLDVDLDAEVFATFSEDMDPLTVTTATFELTGPGAVPVSGRVLYDVVTSTAIFTPDSELTSETSYTATITTGARDLAGNPMADDYVWTFDVPDVIAPYVISTDPEDGALEVDVGLEVYAAFSEDMNPIWIRSSTFTVTGPGATAVPGVVTYDAGLMVAIFTPDSDLLSDTDYVATITTGARDLAGNPMDEDYVWTFSIPDLVAPTVIDTDPADGDVDVDVDAEVFATFSEDMDPATITNASFELTGPSSFPVSGRVLYDAVTGTAIFTPDSALMSDTTYTATITTGARDLAGNPLDDDYVWSFAVPDVVAPYVIETDPEDGAFEVAVDAEVYATFSEAMNPLSILPTTFTLVGPDMIGVPGAVSYDVGLQMAIFTPDTELETESTYTATITTGAWDLAGNPLEEDYVWTFTVPDQGSPTVLWTMPEDGEGGTDIDATVNATFSEEMDPLTILSSTFAVTGPGTTTVTGVVSYDVTTQTATFTPLVDLLEDTTYTATITTGAEDLAGNGLEDDYVWTFSTPVLLPVNLRSLDTFVAAAGAGLTNSNTADSTILGGDVALSPLATCLGDGLPCSATNPIITGTLYANDPDGVAALAKADLVLAYIDGAGRASGTPVSDISGLTLPPGVYTAGSTLSMAVGATTILDGEGDENAVWIFQVGSSMTINNSAKVLLINGAKAENVFWAVFASSTIGSNVSFQGSVMAGASNSVGVGSVVVGRLLCTTGAITLLSNNITLPTP